MKTKSILTIGAIGVVVQLALYGFAIWVIIKLLAHFGVI